MRAVIIRVWWKQVSTWNQDVRLFVKGTAWNNIVSGQTPCRLFQNYLGFQKEEITSRTLIRSDSLSDSESSWFRMENCMTPRRDQSGHEARVKIKFFDFTMWILHSTAIMSLPLTDDDKDDLLLAARYGDLEDVQSFVVKHGASTIADIRDENGNSILHMVCANDHLGEYTSERFFHKSSSHRYRMNFRSFELSTSSCPIIVACCTEQFRLNSPTLGCAQRTSWYRPKTCPAWRTRPRSDWYQNKSGPFTPWRSWTCRLGGGCKMVRRGDESWSWRIQRAARRRGGHSGQWGRCQPWYRGGDWRCRRSDSQNDDLGWWWSREHQTRIAVTTCGKSILLVSG